MLYVWKIIQKVEAANGRFNQGGSVLMGTTHGTQITFSSLGYNQSTST